MEETILFPSPNWFQVSGLVVTSDGWLIYGGPSKSICVLERLPATSSNEPERQRYYAHVHNWAHNEKIISIAVSPEWPEKRNILVGSADGAAKQWTLIKEENSVIMKTTQSHEIHSSDKEEITGVDYCNNLSAVTVGGFGNVVKWDLNSNVVKTYNLIKTFRPTCMSCSQHLPFHVAVGTKQGVLFVLDLSGHGKIVYKVRGQDEEILNISWCPQYMVEVKKSLEESAKRSISQRMDKIRHEAQVQEELETSGLIKQLPNDSFGEAVVVVPEDDMFDIYKDHAADEFGHKKYEPEDIIVKVKSQDEVKDDYLVECEKLKQVILKKKNEPEPSIESLVNALDQTHVSNESDRKPVPSDEHHIEPALSKDVITNNSENNVENSDHIHKHLLASIGKYGAVRIWSKTGKLVASCSVANNAGGKNQRNKSPSWTTLLWYKPNLLLIADGKGQLLESKPLQVNCKNKLEWRLLHSLHKRCLYCIASNAPRVQTPDSDSKGDWIVWTAAQDRNLIAYSMESRKCLSHHNTCGGFLYNIATCPYDARKFAVGVGDGAVRVWETDTLADDDTLLAIGNVAHFWQNVLGKVLTVAWHPTRENLLAFATAESRVGLIDTSGRGDKPARVLSPALSSGVYSLCWGEGNCLYACGGGELVAYSADKHDNAPSPVNVCVEGQNWEVQYASWSASAGVLCVGEKTGGIAVLDHNHKVLCAAYVYSKMIHSIEWHPHQTSGSSEESTFKNHIAVCSIDRLNTIVIVHYVENEGGNKKLESFKTLSGHKDIVLQLAWNPHRDMQLLSTSKDSTLRVWDCSAGVCTHAWGYDGSGGGSAWGVSGAWLPFPTQRDAVLSAGTDCCLRLWQLERHPIDKYIECETTIKKDKKRRKKAEDKPKEESCAVDEATVENTAVSLEAKLKTSKKFLFPIMHKQISSLKIDGAKKMLQIYLEKNKVNFTSLESHNGTENGTKDLMHDENHATDSKGNGVDITTDDENNGDAKTTDHKDNGVGETTDHKHNSDVIPTECKDNGDCQTADDKKNGDAKTTDRKDSVANHTSNVMKNKEFGVDFLKIFGSINDINELLDMELSRHKETNEWERWLMVSMFRGHIDAMIQFANEKDLLSPFLLSIAPCVSLKYWKDVTKLYLNQIDRCVAKDEEHRLFLNPQYGGAVYRKMAALLSVHDVRATVTALLEANLYKEAYVLCRIRYMDSIADDVLREWASFCESNGALAISAICYMALGDLSQAATVLGKSNKQDYLSLAAEIAKQVGRTTYAGHIEEKRDQIKKSCITRDETEQSLEELPSRIQLLMKEADKE